MISLPTLPQRMQDDRLRSSFAAIHDRDARQLDLPEVTFAEMPGLVGPLNALAQAAMTGDRLLADTGLAELIGQLGGCKIVLRGGLPPRLLRLLEDWIEVHLGETIRLEDLARIADLSPFHLQSVKGDRAACLDHPQTDRLRESDAPRPCTNHRNRFGVRLFQPKPFHSNVPCSHRNNPRHISTDL